MVTESLKEYREKIKDCSESELRGILDKIDKEKHPDRYQAATEELKSRRSISSIFLDDPDSLPDYAGFWRRAVAMVIDCVILWIPSWLITKVFWSMVNPELRNYLEPDRFAKNIEMNPSLIWKAILMAQIVNLGAVILFWIYDAVMESSPRQATYGKYWMGIQVTDLQGKRISFGRASIRFFSKIFSSLLFCVGYLMAAFTKKKQCLHDMIAGTLVVCRPEDYIGDRIKDKPKVSMTSQDPKVASQDEAIETVMPNSIEEYKQKLKTCSTTELEEILRIIDKEKYPDRYQAGIDELNSRSGKKQ